MKKLRYLIAATFSGVILFSVTPALAQPAFARTASSDDACATLKNLNPDDEGCNAAGGGVESLIKLALNLLSMVAGIIAVIMLIVAGFKYMTAQGDSNSISSAKNSIIYAVVGLVIVAMAQFIVRFVLAESLKA